MTHAVAPTRAGLVRPKLDQICADAVDLARDAVTEDVPGAYIEAIAEGERLVTHYFECTMTGYRGWRWAVTVARTSRSKQVTICETVLLPGPDALTTPDWVPWNERVQPGDLGIGDLMPTAADDDRLVPGYLLSEDPAVDDVVWELGLGRVRVMSRDGRIDAAERWYEGDHGPQAPIALAAPANARCVSCGFFLPLAGSMRALFGACANLYAPDDGRVVSGDHGCGAHSEVLIEQVIEVDEAPTIYDDAEVEPVAVAASVEAVGDIESIDEIVATSTIEIIPESVSTEGATDVAAVEAATDVAGAESESASVQAAGDAEATTETVLVERDGDFGSFEIVAENVPFESIVEVATVEDLAETAAVDFARAQPDGSVDESDTAETNAGPVDAASSDVIDQPDAFEFDAADRFEPAVEGEVQTFGDEPEAAMVEPEAVTSGNDHDAAMVEPEAVTFADDHDAAVIESEVAAVEPEATTFEPEAVTVRDEPGAATFEDEPEAVAFEPEAVTVRDEPGVATFEDEPEAVALEPEVVTFEDEPEATMVEDGRVAEADVLPASGDDEAAAEFTETETEPAAGDDLSVDDALVEAPEPAVAEVAQSAPLDFEPAADDADDLAAVVVEPAGGELIEPTMVEPAGGELPEPVAAETGPSATLAEPPDADTPVFESPDAELPDAELPDGGTPEAETQVAESSDAETPVFESPGAEASSEDAPVAESSDIETPSAFDLGSEVPVVDEHEATETLVATETYEDPATVEALAEPHALEFPDDDDADDDEHPEAPQAFDLGSDVSPTENDVSPTENPETI